MLFAPDFLAQNSTKTFLLIKCSRKERLISPELLINWKPENKLLVIHALLFNSKILVFFYNLIKLPLIEIKVNM